MASCDSGSNRTISDLESSGAITAKDGFSVVAAMSRMPPLSTEGSNASC